MMYLWTASGRDPSSFRKASGVSDNADNARRAAETLLRTGQAGSASIECAYTAMTLGTLSLCYIRTGTGWRGQLGQAGQVNWTPFGWAPFGEVGAATRPGDPGPEGMEGGTPTMPGSCFPWPAQGGCGPEISGAPRCRPLPVPNPREATDW